MPAVRLPFLIFFLLLFVVTLQNGQTHPVHKQRSVAARHNKFAAVPAHRWHSVAATRKKRSKAAAHRRHPVIPAHRALTDRPIRSIQTFPDTLRYRYINSERNRIVNPDHLNKLSEKLKVAVLSEKKVVRIVHLGDSHIQADMMTSVLRKGLQSRYGNAGRGILFPWQLARTNAPSDVWSLSDKAWSAGRISLVKSSVECGISGYGLQSDFSDFVLEVGLKPGKGDDDAFDMVRLFTGKNSGTLNIRYNGAEEQVAGIAPGNAFCGEQIVLGMKTSSIALSRASPDSTSFQFYGVSFEKKDAQGVIYHAIGVNGAEFASYNRTPLFYEQIGALNADCYIISLGTNEAQNQKLNPEDFGLQVRTMLANLKRISPDAAFVITTPPPSFFHRDKINPAIQTVRDVLVKISNEEHISLWDLYALAGGEAGQALFQTYGFYRPDLLHFNRAGYELQGDLLLSALLKILDK